MTINPARIGTSEAELRRVYASAKARLYSAPKALALAERIREERSNAAVANTKLAEEIASLRADRRSLQAQVREKERLLLKIATLENKLDEAVPPSRLIVRSIAQQHNVSQADIEGPGRTKRIYVARQHVCFELACKTKLSLSQISRHVGGRDHSAIIHNIKKHAQRHGLELPRGMRW